MLNFLYYLRVKEYNDGGVRRNKVHCVGFLKKKSKNKKERPSIHTNICTHILGGDVALCRTRVNRSYRSSRVYAFSIDLENFVTRKKERMEKNDERNKLTLF